MARSSRILHVALLALLSATAVHAQNDLPDLATVTDATTTADKTTAATTAKSTGDTTTAEKTAESTNTAKTTSGGTTASGTGFTATASFPDATTTTSAGSVFQLTGLPTIAGVGVPTLVIPYTANAPFMQKSSMPEGTVFIAIGAVLGFMGACVLAWRGLLAWSINRSVKRAAMASLRGAEKSGWGGSYAAGAGSHKSTFYKDYDPGSSMSLDQLTSAGKTAKPGKHDDAGHRKSSAPPAGLFFSPTAQQGQRHSTYNMDGNRESTYLPAGYYASPSGEIAGGRNSTVIGGSLAPYARNSGISASPPGSPNLPNSRSTSNYYGGGVYSSRDGIRHSSREGLRAPPSRDGYAPSRHSNLYPQPSSSSLAVGDSPSDLPGQRAPSQILDEMFDNHGNGPRERF
ncbi:hypothetical protein AC578_8078 [Pseudocercospora eumusae]|uniref:Uncharacterized protein n=1 Tax=Pseudocercospora eumusae TaxID=321146 RepID=A0A139H0H8_9PEZI|nr:hypothetical protein AC578_8078 [Pseudocercospora eumusae]